MATPDPGRGFLIGGGPAPIGGVRRFAEVDNTAISALLGVSAPVAAETSMLERIVSGVGAGVLDPLSFITPVGNVVERLKMNAGDDLAGKVGFGVGYLSGFLIPGGLATKAGTYGVNALHGVKGLQLLKTADAATELTRLGMFTQGAIAGGLLSAGLDADASLSERGIDTAAGMVLGGVGDIAIQSAFRAVSAAWGGNITKAAEKIVKEAVEEGAITTPESATMLGRAQNIIDDLFRKTDPDGKDLDNIALRKWKLRFGVDELGLNEIEEGMIKIIPSFSPNDDIKKVLDMFPELRYETVERTMPSGQTVTDVMVGKREQIHKSAVESFKKYGYVPGQSAVWKSRTYILSKPSKNPEFVMAITADATQKLRPIPRAMMQLNPLIAPTISKFSTRNPHSEWLAFAKANGPFPFRVPQAQRALSPIANMVTPDPSVIPPLQGFEVIFEEFAKQQRWTPQVRQDMRIFFAKQQRQALRAVDDGEMGKVIDIQEKNAAGKDLPHPVGDLDELAAQKGLARVRVPVPSKKVGGKGRWGYVYKDVDSGQVHGPFTTKRLEQNFLVPYGPRLKRIDPDSPIAEGALPINGTVGVTQMLNQADVSNTRFPASITGLMGIITPNIHYIRRMSDELIKQLGDAAPDLYTPFSRLLSSMTTARSEAKVYVDRLTKIRGGGLIKSPNVRSEKYEDLFEVIQSPREEWAEKAAEAGLNAKELSMVGEFRSLYDDMFKIAADAGTVDIEAKDFVENYLPHIMNRIDSDWVQSYIRKNGRAPSTKVKDWVSELERTGTLTAYEKDPFAVTYRYINGLFFKKNVHATWKELDELVGQIPTQRSLDKMPNAGLIQLKQSMQDTLAMLRGNPGEAWYAARATLEAVSKNMGMPLDENTMNRAVNTLIASNYGAFMGWRAALAVRNITQIFMTALPVVGPKHLGIGIKQAVADGAEKELIEMGVMAKGAVGMPLQDLLHQDQIARQTIEHAGGALGRGVSKFGQGIRYATQKSLGLQAMTDSFNRRVTYYAQKSRTMEALGKWTEKGWDMDEFNYQAGLSAMGESVTRQFHRMIPRENPVEAAKWLAREVTNDVQFMYQAGAGPQVFNSTAGKLFGQYGTWPSWYASLLQNRLTKGTTRDKVRFAAWTGLVHGAFATSVYTTGINATKWTALQFGWAGGPGFEVLKNASDIIGGETVSGAPTARRTLALADYGMTDPGGGLFNVKDPRRLIEGTAGMFIPGSYVIKDIQNAMQESNPIAAGLRATGFQLGMPHERPDFMR